MNGTTVSKYVRVYMDGYGICNYVHTIGPLATAHVTGPDDPICSSLSGTWLGQGSTSIGTLNGYFDTTAVSGLHVLAKTPALRTMTITLGSLAAPVAGDPVFCGEWTQQSYEAAPTDNPNTVTMKFGATSGTGTNPVTGTTINRMYDIPWGVLAHAAGAETAVNTAIGIDQLATTTCGGWMLYHVTGAIGTGSITATLKIQHADTNVDGSFSDLLSSGVINCGSTGTYVPTYGAVALANTISVSRYIRWQVVFGTATSVTFVLSFMRGYFN